MKPRTISIAVLALVSALILSASHVSGVQSSGPQGCSEATLNGSYGFYGTGTTSDGPYAAVGTLNFDGKGNCKRRQGVSRNGAFETNHL